MKDRPLTVHMRRYIAALSAGTSLRQFGVRYDSVRKALVARGLLERYRLGGPTSTRYAYRLTGIGWQVAATLPRCSACSGHRGFTLRQRAECSRCGGTGIDVEEEHAA